MTLILRMRYIPEPLACHMTPEKKGAQNIQIVPFFWLYTSPDDPHRVAAVEQVWQGNRARCALFTAIGLASNMPFVLLQKCLR
jgi:hypothetical protein